MDIKTSIRAHALKNAILFKGTAQMGAVVGKILSEFPEEKKDMKNLSQTIKSIVSEVNALSSDEQKQALKELAPDMLKKKKREKRGLPELPNAVDGKVVTRIPPEPSKYLHVGHAMSFLLNYLYAQKYNGSCVLRFEDSNPLKAKQEYVDAIKEDILEYLNIKPSKIIFESDNLERLYEYAEKLIQDGHAYVCFCSRESMQNLRHEGKPCWCRDSTPEKNINSWTQMKSGEFEEGECVLRIKGDMESTNHVMRDSVLFRICKTPHYRQKTKYAVWPLYDFAASIEENLCDVTHILRSNEFGKMRVEFQSFLKKLLGLSDQTAVQYGRISIVGTTTKGREIRALIEDGKVMGWDDPSLVTLRALKRRGFVKEALYELTKEVGLSAAPTNLDWSVLTTHNKRILDPLVDRYFFVEDPIEITVFDAPTQTVALQKHPDHPERGTREFAVKDTFLIQKKDYNTIVSGDLVRLMDCLNFKKEGSAFTFASTSYEDYQHKGSSIIHWLPSSNLVDIEILMPDHSVRKGKGEHTLKTITPGTIVQFPRVGFCRLDSIQGNIFKFWYTHD